MYGYTFISRANLKFFQQNFTRSRAARADANAQSTLFKACRCLSSLYNFQVYVSDMATPFNCRDL